MANNVQPKLIGVGLGVAVSGVTGGVIGASVGSAATLIPAVADIMCNILGSWRAEGIMVAVIAARQHLKGSQHIAWRNPLGDAYREAFRRALFDIGSTGCRGQKWPEQRESPPRNAVFDIDLIRAINKELGQEVCQLFEELQDAAAEIFVAPAATSFVAVARTLGETKTIEDMRDLFFEESVAPRIRQHDDLLERIMRLWVAERNRDEELNDLEQHLRRQMLPLTLRHLGDILSEESSASQVYTQLLLDQIQRSQQGIAINETRLTELATCLDQELPEYIQALADRFDEVLEQRIDQILDLETEETRRTSDYTLLKHEETAHDSLEITLGLSLDELTAEERRLYAVLSIFPKNQPINPTGVVKLYHGLQEIGKVEALEFLHDMVDRSLLDKQEAAESIGSFQFLMNDFLRNLMREELGSEGRVAGHMAILRAYRDTQEGAGWHTAPDDGYLYNHLVYHLVEVGEDTRGTPFCGKIEDEIQALFVDDEWLQKRVPADEYRFDGYLADLDLAWQWVYGNVGNTDGALSYCLHYAFIYTSINSLASAYQPAELATAVGKGWWPVERAFGMARLKPEFRARVKAMSAILDTDVLTEEQEVRVRQERLAAAFRLRTFALVGKYDSFPQANLLKKLAPSLKYNWEIEEVLEAANSFGGDGQFTVYDSVVRETPDHALPVVLSAVNALPANQGRRRFLLDLLPRLKGETRESALDDLMEEVFESMGDEGLAYYYGDRIRKILVYLDRNHLEKLLERIESLQTANRIYAWSWLVAFVPQTQQTELARRAFLAAQSLPWTDRARDEALPLLAPFVAEKDLVEVLALVLEIPDEYEYIQGPILVALAPRLQRQPWLIATARHRAKAIIRTKVREAVLNALERSPDSQDDADGDIFTEGKEEVSKNGAPEMPPAPTFERESLRSVTPTEPDREDLVRLNSRARTVAGQSGEDGATLSGIDFEGRVKRKRSKQASRDLESALQYFSQGECQILYDLLPDLQAEDLNKVVSSLHRAPDPLSLLTLVPSLLPRLDPATWAAAQEAITAVLIRLARTEIEKVASTNPEDIVTDFKAKLTLMSMGGGIFDTHQVGVGAAAAHLDMEARQRILEAVVSDGGNHRNRAELLALLLPHIEKESAKLAMRCLETLLDSLDDETAVRCLRALSRGGFALHLDAEKREQEIVEVLEMAISEAPTVNRAPNDYRLKDLRRRYKAACQLRLIALLAPYLHESCLTTVLDLVEATKNGDDSGYYAQAKQLVLLVPMLNGDLLTHALQLALVIYSDNARAHALEALDPSLSIEQFWLMLDKIARIDQWSRYGYTGQRATAIQAIAPFTPVALQEQLISLVASVTDEGHRANSLIALAPFLDQDNISLVVEVAVTLEDDILRSMALSHLPGVTHAERRQAVADSLWSLRQQSLSSLVAYLADKRLQIENVFSPTGMRYLLDDLTLWERWRWVLEEPGEV